MNFFDTDFLKTNEIMLRVARTSDENPEKNWVPAYYFDICLPDGQKIGDCDLRIGHNQSLYYGGNIGYAIDAAYRGHHYATKACRLLFDLARKHDLGYVIITCNPENVASRKTCEYAGGTLLEVCELPKDNDMYQRGERSKCIFRFDL